MENLSKIVCIVPFRLMDIKINAEDCISVIQGPLNVRTIQLESYLSVLKPLFFYRYKKGVAIKIQEFFEVLDCQEFWAKVRPVRFIQLVNGYGTLVNINLIKVSVFLICNRLASEKNIDEYLRGFQLIDPKKKGKVPKQVNFIFSSFVSANRFFPRNLITIWLEKNSQLFISESELHIHEYLFLSCNAYSRSSLIETYLSRVDLYCNEKKDGLFKIKESSSISDPDERLDQILGTYYKNMIPTTQHPIEVKKSKVSNKKIDKIIQRTFSNKKMPPNPYRKALADKPLARCASRFSNFKKLSIAKIPHYSRPATAIKDNQKSIDLSKVESANSLIVNSSKDPYHITTLREAVLNSYRLLQRKMIRSPSYIVKSKLDVSK